MKFTFECWTGYLWRVSKANEWAGHILFYLQVYNIQYCSVYCIKKKNSNTLITAQKQSGVFISAANTKHFSIYIINIPLHLSLGSSMVKASHCISYHWTELVNVTFALHLSFGSSMVRNLECAITCAVQYNAKDPMYHKSFVKLILRWKQAIIKNY